MNANSNTFLFISNELQEPWKNTGGKFYHSTSTQIKIAASFYCLIMDFLG